MRNNIYLKKQKDKKKQKFTKQKKRNNKYLQNKKKIKSNLYKKEKTTIIYKTKEEKTLYIITKFETVCAKKKTEKCFKTEKISFSQNIKQSLQIITKPNKKH